MGWGGDSKPRRSTHQPTIAAPPNDLPTPARAQKPASSTDEAKEDERSPKKG